MPPNLDLEDTRLWRTKNTYQNLLIALKQLIVAAMMQNAEV